MCNKGFSGYLSILPRSKFDVDGQGSRPQSLTAHSLNRFIIAKGNTNHLIIKHLKNYLKKLCKTLESFKKIFNFAKLKI